jgi:AraC-like DNA-binding protein
LVWCRGETFALSPGSVLVVEPGDVQRDVRKTAYAAVTVELQRELAQGLHAGDFERGPTSPRLESAALARELVLLVEVVRANRERGVQEQQVTGILDLLRPFWTRVLPRPEPALVTRARRALAESSIATLSLDQLAARLRCAPTYLCRVFSEHTGVGPHTYQLQQRLLQAGRLIESGRSVSHAAALTGFGDASHLRRHFRRRFAIAPGRYQKDLVSRVSAA